MPATTVDFQNPLTIGTRDQFAQLRHLLTEAGFVESAVCERSGIESIFDFESQHAQAFEPHPFLDRLEFLLRVLMHGHLARESDALAVLKAQDLALFQELGVLARSPEGNSLLYSTVVLYPVQGVYIASDRNLIPIRDWKKDVPPDVVFSGISRHTRIFLGSIPRDPCERLLDLCAGSGVAGIIAGAQFAKRAWATDLGERCVHFSEFSRLLNGLENVETAAGDLYDAVPGEQFDRIIAHPPYIPNKETSILFRDGGEDGEQVFRRVIEGAPAALAPGGRLHCVTFASDRQSGELEDRLRAWLGPDEKDFDVIVVASDLRNRPNSVIKGLGKAGEKMRLGETGEMLERLGVTSLFYGSVMVQRKPDSRPGFSARTFRSPKAPLSAAEAFREHVTRLYGAETERAVPNLVPRLSEHMTLHVVHKPGSEGLQADSYSVRLDFPFVSEAKIEPWVAYLLSACDGQRTLAAIYQQLLAEGVMSEATTPREFWEVMRLLATGGYIKI